MATLTQTQSSGLTWTWRGLQLVTGLIWLVFGLNGFLQFLPMPPPAAEMGALLGALAASGYFFPLVKACEVLAGLMLVSNKFSNFALVLLAPILVNIIAIHLFLDPGGLLMGLVLGAMHLALVYSRWDDLKVIFKA